MDVNIVSHLHLPGANEFNPGNIPLQFALTSWYQFHHFSTIPYNSNNVTLAVWLEQMIPSLANFS